MHTAVKARCTRHSRRIALRPVDVLHGGSETCSACQAETGMFNRKPALEEINKRAAQLFPHIEILSYRGMLGQSRARCSLHRTRFGLTLANLLHRKNVCCPKCTASSIAAGVLRNRAKNFAAFAKKLSISLPHYVVKEKDYTNTASPLRAYCKKHECSFVIPNPDVAIRQKCRSCPQCLLDTRSYSPASLEWIKYAARTLRFQERAVRTAVNGGEVFLTGIGKVDGFHKRSGTVFEFHGDVYHGNPKLFSASDTPHPYKDVTAGELLASTRRKERAIRKAGYTLIVIWESDWKKLKGKLHGK